MSGPNRSCVNCHFFVRETRDPGDGRALNFVVPVDAREFARTNDFSWHESHWSLACDFGVWDQGCGFDVQHAYEVVVKTERGDDCFFWPCHSGMLLPAARTLQEREAAGRAANRDRRLTVIGLWIAAVALVANLAITIGELL